MALFQHIHAAEGHGPPSSRPRPAPRAAPWLRLRALVMFAALMLCFAVIALQLLRLGLRGRPPLLRITMAEVAAGRPNPLLATITADSDFRLTAAEAAAWIDPVAFTGRSARQVDEFLDEVVVPALRGAATRAAEEPRV